MPTRSGITPQTGMDCDFHHAIASSRSFVPRRAAQMTTPRGVRAGMSSRVESTGEYSTPPALVGITTASAELEADCRSRSSPGGVSTTTRPSSRPSARFNVRSDGASTTSTPSRGRASSHSAEEPCRSASTRTTGSYPRSRAAAARYTDVVVLPTPPLMFDTTTLVKARILRDRPRVAARLLAHLDLDRQPDPAEGAHVAVVRAERPPERGLHRVADAVPRRLPPDDLRDVRIVRVLDAREEVMLDLVVEAAEEPGQHRIARAEVDRRLHLVHSPHAPVRGQLLGGGEIRLLDAMRELERRGRDEARQRGEARVAEHDHPPGIDEERHDDRPADEDRLAADDAREVPALRHVQRALRDPPADDRGEIGADLP